MTTNANEINRITENLAHITANRLNLSVHFPKDWVEEAEAEGRAAGILPPQKAAIGINCRQGIDNGIIYGGDMEDAL